MGKQYRLTAKGRDYLRHEGCLFTATVQRKTAAELELAQIQPENVGKAPGKRRESVGKASGKRRERFSTHVGKRTPSLFRNWPLCLV